MFGICSWSNLADPAIRLPTDHGWIDAVPQTLNDILDLFVLEDAGHGTFIGPQPRDGLERVRVYGGQVVAQAIAAAARTVSGRRVHSLHASFLRPGNPRTPLQYDVTALRDGRTFATRRVSVGQGGVVIMEALVSFVIDIDGDEFQQPMPAVPDPETLTAVEDQLSAHLTRTGAPDADEYVSLVRFRVVEMRYVDPPPRIAVDATAPAHAECRLWFRTRSEVPDDAVLRVCLLAYVSDWTILDPVQIAIGKTWQQLEKMASLDHAMWFHRPPEFADWLLYEQHAPTVIGGTGVGRGAIYNRNGALVCTVAQEGYVGRRL